MVDSTANQLLTKLQTDFTNYQNNINNQRIKRIKGVIINNNALLVQLLYSASNNSWSINVTHVLTGLAVSDFYTSYQLGLDVYNAIG